jgi:PKD repeat protein
VTNGSGSIGYEEEADYTIVMNGTSLPPGYYNRTIYIVTNDLLMGSFPVNVSVEIRENITPMAEAGSDAIIGQHETAILDGTNSTDNTVIINWTWTILDHDGRSLYYDEISQHTFHEAGTFTAYLSVHDYALNFAWDNFTITVLDTTDPIADAGSDIIIDQHETVMFNGSNSFDNVEVVEYIWEFIDGSTDVILNDVSPSHTFHEAGEYMVNLTVRDAMGNNGTDLIIVEVKDITPPAVDAGPDMVVDQNQIFILNGTMCTDNVCIVNWTWIVQLDGRNRMLYGMIVEYSIPDAGVFEVTLNVSDSSGNYNNDSLSIEVLDITPPMLITQGNVTIDQFSSLVLNATRSSDNVGLANFTWKIQIGDNDRVLYGPSPSIVFDKVGVYEAMVLVSDTSLNIAFSTFTITVQDREDPVIVCDREHVIDQHQELVLNASSPTDNVGVTNYTWNVHLGTVTIMMEGAINSIVIDEAGSFTVDLNVSDSRGNWAVMEIDVTVRDITDPVPRVEMVSEIYSGNSTVLNASLSEDNVGIVLYQWSFRYDGQDIVLDGQKMNYTFDIPGSYNITLTIRDAEGNEAEETYDLTVLSSIIGDDDDDDGTDDDEDDPKDSQWALFMLIFGGIALLIIVLIGLFLILRYKERPESWGDEE